jgi:DnaJ-like protein
MAMLGAENSQKRQSTLLARRISMQDKKKVAMAYTNYLDTLQAYWPGAQQVVRHVIKLSLSDAYRGGQRTIERDGMRMRVTIPAGVHTNAKIYYPRLGRQSAHEADYCTVLVHDEPPFKRCGDDLHLEFIIDAFTAILGGEVVVPTLLDKATLSIPAGTAPGTTLRMEGLGMPMLGHPQQHGDLCVHLRVTVPDDATELERKLIADTVWLRGWHLGHH